MSNNKKHDSMVKDLADRLRSTGTYDTVQTEVPLFRDRRMTVEMDVCAMRTANNKVFMHYYEVKSGDEKCCYNKAIVQREHFFQSLPRGVHGKFIYVTPTRVEYWGKHGA